MAKGICCRRRIRNFSVLPNDQPYTFSSCAQKGREPATGLKPLHTRYANCINHRFNWRGHFWQGRFFSSPLDEDYMWAAIRYIERNPVRAKIVSRAEEYKWSSAAGHCGLYGDPLLNQDLFWQNKISEQANWSDWLAESDNKDKLEILRRNINKNIPCGVDSFIKKLEKISHRFLQYRAQGRPKINKI